jgi:uncharacterized protein
VAVIRAQVGRSRSAAANLSDRNRSEIGLLPDGKRLHLHDGPIDLIVEADGSNEAVREAYNAASKRFRSVLDELCDELTELRRQAKQGRTALTGPIARRMHAAVAPFARVHFITPMAAVAGAVAEEILDAMTSSAELVRAYVNNGGDIACHLAKSQSYSIGLVDRPDQPAIFGHGVVTASSAIRGIATSGRHGRSFSLGIADAVTILADTASKADAAATIVANAVDLPGNPGITRCPAWDLDPDSDLQWRPVVRDVARLSTSEVAKALDAGATVADAVMAEQLIVGAALRLQCATRVATTPPAEGQTAIFHGTNFAKSPPDPIDLGWRSIAPNSPFQPKDPSR